MSAAQFIHELEAMSKSERESIFASLVENQEWREDLFDLMTIADRRNEPVRPIDEVFSDSRSMHEVAHRLWAYAEKELAKLSSEIGQRIGRAIRALEHDPVPASAKRLKGREEFRLRVGDYRVLYLLDHKNHVLTICAIGHRSDVYR